MADAPYIVQDITLAAGASLALSGLGKIRAVYLAEGLSYGLDVGYLSIATDLEPDFVDMAPGDFIRFSGVNSVTVKNNLGSAIATWMGIEPLTFRLLISTDPNFCWLSHARGL
jgi:hypothetical protein